MANFLQNGWSDILASRLGLASLGSTSRFDLGYERTQSAHGHIEPIAGGLFLDSDLAQGALKIPLYDTVLQLSFIVRQLQHGERDPLHGLHGVIEDFLLLSRE